MEAIDNIVAEMRKDIPRVVDAKIILRNYADRIEAAHKRKVDRIHQAMVLIAGIEIENSQYPPRLWTALDDAYDALCDALGTDGDTSSDVEEAKAIGRHFVVKSIGNAAKMREALEELIANIEMRSSSFGLNVMVDTKTFLDAKAILSAPPRNCDLYKSEPEAYQAYLTAMKNATKKTYVYFEPWLFAEVKGANDEK